MSAFFCLLKEIESISYVFRQSETVIYVSLFSVTSRSSWFMRRNGRLSSISLPGMSAAAVSKIVKASGVE